MKKKVREVLKKNNGGAYFTDGNTDIEEIDDDPIRRIVISAQTDPQVAENILKVVVDGYHKFKINNYDPPFKTEDLNPQFIWTKKKNDLDDIYDYIPELFMDFVIQSLRDTLSGEKMEDAFCLSLSGGRPTAKSGKDIDIAIYYEKELLIYKKKEAVFNTSKKFNITEQRVRRIHQEYKDLPNFQEIVKHTPKGVPTKFGYSSFKNEETGEMVYLETFQD